MSLFCSIQISYSGFQNCSVEAINPNSSNNLECNLIPKGHLNKMDWFFEGEMAMDNSLNEFSR